MYPWGNDPDPERANYNDTALGTTNTVGCFPGGASPYGVEEVSGNVVEWTRSLWRVYPYPSDRVARSKLEELQAPPETFHALRGGALWSGHQGSMRCAYRVRNVARVVDPNLGFRVALAGPP